MQMFDKERVSQNMQLTRESVDEIPDEACKVGLDVPDDGRNLLVALALQVEAGAVDVLGEGGQLKS